METALILSVDSWELTDPTSGEVRRGVSLYFVNQYCESSETSVGLRPTKAPASPEVFESVRKGGAPALYRLGFRTRPGKESKPVLMATQAELVRKLDFFGESTVSPVDRKVR